MRGAWNGNRKRKPRKGRRLTEALRKAGAVAPLATSPSVSTQGRCVDRCCFCREMAVGRRTIAGSAALAVIFGCDSGEGALPLEIRQLNPTSIGARTPDFDLVVSGTGF